MLKYKRGCNPNSHILTEKRKDNLSKCRLLGNSKQARKKSVETRKKHYIFWHSKETRNKIRNTLKQKYTNGLIKSVLKGIKLSDERKINHSKIMKEKYKQGFNPKGMLGKSNKWGKHSEETKEKIRIKSINQILEGRTNKINTNIEILMKKYLLNNNLQFIHQYNFNNKFICDFAIPEYKIIIECDGDYWHNREDIKNRDKSKNAYIKKCGWRLLRFWEKDIINNPNECIKIILEEIWKK